MYMLWSYQDWLKTQDDSYVGQGRISWLLDVPQLYNRRAPGNTCLSALCESDNGKYCESYVESRINDSKGCGAVMRVAPLGIHYKDVPVETLMEEAAEISAITHGHELGYMPSAALTYILNQIVYSEGKSLREIVSDAIRKICDMYAETEHVNALCSILEKAAELAVNRENDIDNIHELGEGWVAEEALAIAVYCALRHFDDFSKCIIAAVNHNGDSDSRGAVCGNILGAYLGYDAIPKKYKEHLELHDIIIEIADKENDILLLEISDHQLVDMYDFKCDISALLNLSETHLDLHGTYDNYKKAKKKPKYTVLQENQLIKFIIK